VGLFDKLLGKKEPPKLEEAVIVYLDGVNLSDEIYRGYDTTTLAEHLEDAITVNRAGNSTAVKLVMKRQRFTCMAQMQPASSRLSNRFCGNTRSARVPAS